ncbi:hypothetical protein MLD38_027654 [Melastoma candidum]|uniref:Uncharacterized protein n=1 Tax=Melastoma candidum TaxID=119954 RepID=A0ACB9P3Y8_9MYRT|nr:hypothetical protein MLD38_027654 [Melastoma candidum]
MINAYIKHGMFEEAKELFNKMLEDRDHITCEADYKTRVLPDIYTFNTMLDACFEGKMWDDLEFVFQRLLDHGCHFNVDRHLHIVLESSRAGKSGPLEATWKYLMRMDRIPPPALIKEHFCTKLEKRDPTGALSSVFSDPGSNGPGFSKHAWSKLLKENIRRFRRDGIEGLVNEIECRLPSRTEPNPELETLLTTCKEVLGI